MVVPKITNGAPLLGRMWSQALGLRLQVEQKLPINTIQTKFYSNVIKQFQ